jgi:hypothetical protein
VRGSAQIRRAARSLGRRRHLVAFLFLALALGSLQQGPGFNQTSHYALTRALAHGSTSIDRELPHVGQLSTGDVTIRNGHTYSNKAPGLAFVSVPAFLVAKAAGVATTGDPTTMLWAIGLWSIVLPTLLLAVLVRGRAERIASGTGTTVAVALGLGTLLLPFSGLLFSHPFSAFVAFAAFALLWRERDSEPRLALVAAGGALAGYAVTTEYPNAVGAVVLGVYACARPGFLRRGLAYGAGVAAGVVPLLVFDTLAFGSPFHLSYEARPHRDGGASQIAGLGRGIFGIDLPRPAAAFDVLFSARGLFTLAPVLVAAVVGLVLLFRTRRAEALVIAILSTSYLVWVSAFSNPFGGLDPGPRYLITILPFLAVPLSLALRAFPLPTLALAGVSIANMTMISATGTHPARDGNWVERAAAGTFKPTALAVIGITGWYTIIVFYVACVATAGLAAATLRPLHIDVRWLVVTTLVLAAWGGLALVAPSAGGRFESAGYVVVVCLVALGYAVAAAGRLRSRPSPSGAALAT